MLRVRQTFDLEAALDYLRGFHPKAQEKGELYYQEGNVTRLTRLGRGDRWRAEVEGDFANTVEVTYVPGRRWQLACTCPMTFGCKRGYAAVRAVMDRVGAQPPAKAGDDAASLRKAIPDLTPPPNPLVERLLATLGRPCENHEALFLRKLHGLWLAFSRYGQTSVGNLLDLGLKFPGSPWEQFRPWPSPPADEIEFWQYIAFAAAERAVVLPDFLQCITDTTVVAERIRRARWHQEIAQWNQTLDHWLQDGESATFEREGADDLTGEFDLRLRLRPQQAALEWKRPGQETFSRLKVTEARQLAEAHEQGPAQLPPEAESIWLPFRTRLAIGVRLELLYAWDDDRRVLGRLLRQPGLASRVMTESGQPLEREVAALGWRLQSPAPEQDGHYTLQVVQADGHPAPEVLCVLPGKPTMYLTGDVLPTGPPPGLTPFNLSAPNAIPAPALETIAGVEFLQRLGVELPERIRGKIRKVAVAVAIRCRLHVPPYRRHEECLFEVRAQSSDGTVEEVWDGTRWLPLKIDDRRARSRKEGLMSARLQSDRSRGRTVGAPRAEPARAHL